jgi:N-acyl-D-amino-acid deacylase
VKSIALPLLLFACLGATGPVSPGGAAPESAVLIENATLVDGTGAAPRIADVRVRGERIVEVGTLDAGEGETVVDAHGLTLAPGFIDTHSHHGSALLEQPDALAAISQGITTIVTGQDGGSEVPLADWFGKLEASPAAVNVASYSGHNSLRDAALGEDYKRKATAAEVEKMGTLLVADMAAGAIGLSTGLEYDPGIYSAKEEVLTLAREAAKRGGRYISHIRSEDRYLWDALDEIVEIGRQTGMPVQVSHAKLGMVDWWGQADRFLGVLDKARAEGVKATIDVYPYTYWQSTLTVLWPERDFANRDQADYILKHLVTPEGLLLTSFSAEPALSGKTVAQIAALKGIDPVTTLMALVRDMQATKGSARIIATGMDEGDVAKFLAWPEANLSSDGALNDRHPRGAGAFTRFLRIYVRETKLLPIEAAIHKMTALAAAHMGIADRGTIRPGAYADLVLFDPATVTDHSTTAEPSLISEGIAKVWVNGRLVFGDGKATGEHPGRVIRRGAR